MRIPNLVITFAAIVLLAPAQTPQSATTTEAPPRFEDFQVSEVFSGTPATPQLATTEERTYRTRIRDGVAKGIGVLRNGSEQPGPNFAGHYIVVQWPCGSPCEMMAIVDAKTGHIFFPPLSEKQPADQRLMLPVLILPFRDEPKHAMPIHSEIAFRLNSRLMIVKACPDPAQSWDNYTYHFAWQDNAWHQIYKRRLDKVEP